MAPPPRAQPAQPPAADGRVEVWVDLDLPPVASVLREDSGHTAELADRIARQQDNVMAALLSLGAVEQARVRIVRNALAVRLPASSIDAARHLPGVRGVHAVRHMHTNGESTRSSARP